MKTWGQDYPLRRPGGMWHVVARQIVAAGRPPAAWSPSQAPIHSALKASPPSISWFCMAPVGYYPAAASTRTNTSVRPFHPLEFQYEHRCRRQHLPGMPILPG